MNKEIEKEAEYFDIIVGLLSEPFEYDSFVKTVFTAFIIKNCEPKVDKNVTNLNLISKFMNNLRTQFFINYNDFNSIFKILRLLEDTSCIKIKDNTIFKKNISKEYIVQSNVFKISAVRKTILEIKKMSDKSFMEEVIRYV